MTILYADDDRDDCELLSEALHQIDPSISCMIVGDGKEVFETLNKIQKLPDFIFLDINMPLMTGKQCLAELKKDDRLKNIPVVIYSTTTNREEINQLYALGAASFIRKPDNFKELYTTLNMFVKLVQ